MVYKTKLNPDGPVSKYNEVFAHIARLEIVRFIIPINSSKNCPLYHLDLKYAFINDPLKETVYVTWPLGFAMKLKEHMVTNYIRLYMV